MKKLLLIGFIIFCSQISAQYKWYIPGKMPRPVWGGQLAYDLNSNSTKIYILGGHSDSLSIQGPVNWIQEYDVEKNHWRLLKAHMIQPRQNFVADVYNHKVFYFGGTEDSSKDTNSIESWDFTDTLSSPVYYDNNFNFDRSNATGQIVDSTFYLIGGTPTNPRRPSLPYIVSYNIVNKQTSVKSNLTTVNKSSGCMTFIVGNYIYIFGGASKTLTSTIQKFDISQQILDNLTYTLNSDVAGGEAVYNPKLQKGFIIGGYNETKNSLDSVEQVIINKDLSLNITKYLKLNKPRRDFMAVNYKDGTIAVFGGRNALNGNVVPEFEILIDTTKFTIVGTNKTEKLPGAFKLEQNYPNPFNPETEISYQLSTFSHVQLKIYDLLGKEIRTLVNSDKPAGSYRISWNGTDNKGKNETSGVYFYRLTANGNISTKKMILLK